MPTSSSGLPQGAGAAAISVEQRPHNPSASPATATPAFLACWKPPAGQLSGHHRLTPQLADKLAAHSFPADAQFVKRQLLMETPEQPADVLHCSLGSVSRLSWRGRNQGAQMLCEI